MPSDHAVSQNLGTESILVIEALSGISQALLVVNRKLQIIFVNQRYREMFSVPDELIDVGAPFRSLQRYLARSGEFGSGDLETYVDLREDAIRAGRTFRLERKQPNGRYIEVVGNSLPSGGYVFTFSDVTDRVVAQANLEALIKKRTQALRDANAELERLATLDPLLGIPNRRKFAQDAEVLRRNALRNKTALAVLMIDVDHFKAINDTYGHARGDAVLRAISRAIQAELRPTDVVARFGGEEFAALLPDTDTDGAYRVAERIQAAISRQPGPDNATGITATVSAGVAEWRATEANLEPALGRADAGLYRAKSAGRNQIGR